MSDYMPRPGSQTEKLVKCILKKPILKAVLAEETGVPIASIPSLLGMMVEERYIVSHLVPAQGTRDQTEYFATEKLRKTEFAKSVLGGVVLTPSAVLPAVSTVFTPTETIEKLAQLTLSVISPKFLDESPVKPERGAVVVSHEDKAMPFSPEMQHVRFAAWDDGGIEVVAGDTGIKLSRDATHRLRALINAVEGVA